MIRKANPDTDQISRSLLQKAVRRGSVEMTNLAIKSLLLKNDFDWLRKRLAVVTFEECWSYGLEVSYERDEEIITSHYLRIARTVKNKDAAGLGALAHALSLGDSSMLKGESDESAIKVVSEAIRRPKDFWEWINKQTLDERQRVVVKRAEEGFRKAGWPWDRAFAQAAAYLAIKTGVPSIQFAEFESNNSFPFWVCIDKHTPEGKQALREAARKAGLKANKAMWVAFYFESAKCNEMNASLWWERELHWRMKKLDLSVDQAKNLWEEIKPIVINLVQKHSDALQERLLTIAQSSTAFQGKQPSIF